MFFAAVEIIENPQLKDQPLIVGKSIVSTSNYIARQYGIRSAMPVFLAKELCPGLIIVDVHIDLYKKYSEKFYEVLRKYDPDLLYLGLDECCLELTDYIDSTRDLLAPRK